TLQAGARPVTRAGAARFAAETTVVGTKPAVPGYPLLAPAPARSGSGAPSVGRFFPRVERSAPHTLAETRSLLTEIAVLSYHPCACVPRAKALPEDIHASPPCRVVLPARTRPSPERSRGLPRAQDLDAAVRFWSPRPPRVVA